jgi:pimeloyl-ACP methyl ester carboxylesterase
VIDLDTVMHKWLRIPHLLHVGVDKGPKKPEATVVFIHGLANSHAMWDDIINKLDTSKIRVISVDLLGFGKSPKPPWQTYSAAIHASSLRLTLLKLGVKSPITIVGHSLGTLVSIQYATKYRRGIHNLVLCSPPFYKPSNLPPEQLVGPIKQTDDVYHVLYRNSRNRVEVARRLASFVKTVKLMSKYFVVNDETMPAIISSLEMSIENQTSLEDAKKLTVPVHILYGQFDPFVIKRHLRELKKENANVELKMIPAAHEISDSIFYRRKVVARVKKLAVPKQSKV